MSSKLLKTYKSNLKFDIEMPSLVTGLRRIYKMRD